MSYGTDRPWRRSFNPDLFIMDGRGPAYRLRAMPLPPPSLSCGCRFQCRCDPALATRLLAASLISVCDEFAEGSLMGTVRKLTSFGPLPPQTRVIFLQHRSQSQNRSYNTGAIPPPADSSPGLGVSEKSFPWCRYKKRSEHSGFAHLDTIGAPRQQGKYILVEATQAWSDGRYDFG